MLLQIAPLPKVPMKKKAKDTFQFFKPHKLADTYPARARALSDDVLSKYVSWVLVDRSTDKAGKTYFLMTTSAYKKACYNFAPMTDDFARTARREMELPMREQYAIVEKCEAKIAALQEELCEFREYRAAVDEKETLIGQEIEAVRILKSELQRLIEHLRIGNSPTAAALRGFFARIDQYALNKFTKEVGKKPHRRTQSNKPPT